MNNVKSWKEVGYGRTMQRSDILESELSLVPICPISSKNVHVNQASVSKWPYKCYNEFYNIHIEVRYQHPIRKSSGPSVASCHGECLQREVSLSLLEILHQNCKASGERVQQLNSPLSMPTW